MIRRFHIFRIILAVLVFSLCNGMWFWHAASAATGQIYLTPATLKAEKNKTFTVALRLKPGATVDGVQATVVYDEHKLQTVDVNTTGSAFPVQLRQETNKGSITLVRGALDGGVRDDALVASIRFKAIDGSGSAVLDLRDANASANGSYTGLASTGTKVKLAASTASGPMPGSVPGDSSGAVDITVTDRDIQFSQGIFTIKSKTPVQLYIKYGLGSALNVATPLTDFKTEHKVLLDAKTLVPGETYSYIIVVKDRQGKIAETAAQTFRTKGFTVRVAILDKDREPLKNQRVMLHSDTKTSITDAQGVATFTDVSPGKHDVRATINHKAYDQTIAVDNDIQLAGHRQAADMQHVAVVYDASVATSPWPMIIVTVFSVLLVMSVVFLKIHHFDGHSHLPHFGFQGGHQGHTGYPMAPAPIVMGRTRPAPEQPPLQSPQSRITIESIPYPKQAAPGTTIAPVSKNQEFQDEIRS